MDLGRFGMIGLEISLLSLLLIHFIEMFSDLRAELKDYKENN
jgi:hypothetical protein